MRELRSAGHAPEESEALARERIGLDESFLREMLARPELRSFAFRRPFVAFTLLPLLGFIGLLALCLAITIGSVQTQALRTLGTVFFFGAMWLAPVGVAMSACLLAARRRVPARWVIAGVVLVGLLRAMINGRLDLATPGHESVSLGLGWYWPHLLSPEGWRTALLIPAILLPYLAWLHSHNRLAGRAER